MKDGHFRASALYLLCLLLAAVPVAAQEEDWYVEIGESSDGTYSLYLPSVEMREHYSGDYVVGWIRWTYSDIGAAEYAKNGVKAHHSMDFYAANPKARQIQLLAYTYYDKEGNIIDRDSRSFNSYMWEECTPGTTGEAIWEILTMAAKYIYQP